MRYVFGPVPSRRLGQSLGIDPIPSKTCNWNCVYCQLGRTRKLTNSRQAFAPVPVILDEVRQALAEHVGGGIDWVTFVGSGETTLYSELGVLLEKVKTHTDLPVAVITNGSLLCLPEVRAALTAADAVLPSLDAGTHKLYRRINRPHPDCTFSRHLDGLRAFRQDYAGQLWVEVMLIRGFNDDEEALSNIAGVLKPIRPDQVHIVLPTRPPAERKIHSPDTTAIQRALAILGEAARVVIPKDGAYELAAGEGLEDAVIAIVTRHPMRAEELAAVLQNWSPGRIEGALAELEASGRLQVVERLGIRFYSARGACYSNHS